MKYLLLFLCLTNSANAFQYYNKQILDLTNPAGAITSATMEIAGYAEYSVQLIVTGATTCTAVLQVSSDNVNQTMIDLSGSTIALTSAGAIYSVRGSYRYANVKLTGCAGAGTLKAFFIAKEY